MSAVDIGAINSKIAGSPLTSAPSAITAAKSIATGATTSTQINTSLATAADVSATQSTTTDANLVNITAKGVLLFAAFHSGTNGGSCVGTITIDGVVVYSAGSTGANALKCPVGCVTALDNTAGTSTVGFEAIPFYTSLRIQYKSSVDAVLVGAACKYRLT